MTLAQLIGAEFRYFLNPRRHAFFCGKLLPGLQRGRTHGSRTIWPEQYDRPGRCDAMWSTGFGAPDPGGIGRFLWPRSVGLPGCRDWSPCLRTPAQLQSSSQRRGLTESNGRDLRSILADWPSGMRTVDSFTWSPTRSTSKTSDYDDTSNVVKAATDALIGIPGYEGIADLQAIAERNTKPARFADAAEQLRAGTAGEDRLDRNFDARAVLVSIENPHVC
jgi:hypothetical protein